MAFLLYAFAATIFGFKWYSDKQEQKQKIDLELKEIEVLESCLLKTEEIKQALQNLVQSHYKDHSHISTDHVKLCFLRCLNHCGSLPKAIERTVNYQKANVWTASEEYELEERIKLQKDRDDALTD